MNKSTSRGASFHLCSNARVEYSETRVETLRSTHSRKYESLHLHFPGQPGLPSLAARSIRIRLKKVTIVGGSKNWVPDAGSQPRSTLELVVSCQPDHSIPSSPPHSHRQGPLLCARTEASRGGPGSPIDRESGREQNQ